MNRQFEYADVTDIGLREENQDFHDHVFTADGALLVLADGMGGHQGSALASRCFVQSILKQATAQQHDLVKDPAQTLRRFFAAGAAELAHAVREEQLPEGPHTTCVMAWTTNNTLVCAHIGDSRLYVLAPQGILWQTRDHSIVHLLVEQGEISPYEVAKHPDQGRLYKSISGNKVPEPSIEVLDPLGTGHALLLCSDGFWEYVGADEMLFLLSSVDLNADLAALATRAVNRAGDDSDNVTAQILRKR